MSFDLKLARRCDHRLFRQIRFFEDDRQTVRLGTLLGSTQDFQVRVSENEALPDSAELGWSLVKDEVSVEPGQRKIRFNKKRKALDDWVEISYYTQGRTCPKCSGFDLLFDYEYSNIGLPFLVRDEEKLVQDMEKILLTIRGSSIYYPWYGTLMVTLIGTKQPPRTVKTRLQKEVAEALDNLKSLQEQQETFQIVSDREFIFSIRGVSVVETVDPTLYKVFAKVMTQAGSNAEFARPLRFDQGFLDTRSELFSQRAAF